MTAPVIVYRDLTVHFARAVTVPDQVPQEIEVVCTALSTGSSAAANATFIEGPTSQRVFLSHPDNPITFSLVPSDTPGLDERVLYRIAWRAGGVTGRLFTFDFAMPDADVDFDQLTSLDLIIDGEVYLQQSDLGVPGRVARLNDSGAVVDAFGTPVVSENRISEVEGLIAVERVERQDADASNFDTLDDRITNQFNQAIDTSEATTAAAVTSLTNQIAEEAAVRGANDDDLQDQITALTGASGSSIADLVDDLTHKADLDVDGKVLLSQIPDTARTQGVPVADVNAMLALTYPAQVQPFDFAYGPAGTYALLTTDPSNISNWIKLNKVNTVNGQVGDVVLDHTSVGAAATSHTHATSDITGLASLLSAKADLSGGEIPRAQGSSTFAYVNGSNQITKKDGTVLAGGSTAVTTVNGESGDVSITLTKAATAGGAVPQAQVTGLAASLAAKADLSGGTVPGGQIPFLSTDKITTVGSSGSGLTGIITNNGLTTTSNHESRIASLEVGGGGGGGGSPAKSLWFDGTTDFTGVTNPAVFQTVHNVALKGPWSVDGSGHYSYNADGVPAGGESYVYPYITPNGHLQLRKWDESGAADPALATQSSLDTVESTLTTAVNAKADATTVSSLTTTIAGKADQTDLTTATGRITTVENALPGKADLSGGVLATGQIPTNIPQSSVTGLAGALAAKADLSGGTVPQGQIPSGIPQAKVVNLTSDLAAKADLISGMVNPAQLPAQARITATSVANRSAMLAQSTSAVQPGDLTVITATADKGTYLLLDVDPTQFANWRLLETPYDAVLSVNSQTGTVVLSAPDVGAMAANASIPTSQITGLDAALAAKVSQTYVDNALAAKISLTDVRAENTTSAQAKQRVDYVATSNVLSLSGTQSADGVAMALGSRVLLTAQSSSVFNGIWTVNSSAWTRPSDMASASYLLKGTTVVVRASGTAGTTNNHTLWQATSASGLVDTAANNWTKIADVAPPVSLVNGNGIAVTGTYPSKTVTAVANPSGNCVVTSSGIDIDTTKVLRVVRGTVPSGSATPTITHNLGTNRLLWVTVIDTASGAGSNLVGWTCTGSNTVQLEFASAPSSGQWAYVIGG